MHIAVVGTGNVGRVTAYTIMCEGLADELSLVDIKPRLAPLLAEELKHAAASMRLDVKIYGYERDEDLSGADIVVVSAGYPRPPGVRMSRRELIAKNAGIIKYVAEVVPPRNPGAKYVIVTNPVDAMATLFKRVSRAGFVVSTGNHLETLRFRARLAEALNVPYREVWGFVGGEHGENAVILWSTTHVSGTPVDEYVRERGLKLDKTSIEGYVKKVSEGIIDVLGATRFGPAAAFRDIVRAIARNEGVVLSIATPSRFKGIPEEVFVSVPTVVGRSLGPKLYSVLVEEELEGLRKAAKSIYDTYRKGIELLNL